MNAHQLALCTGASFHAAAAWLPHLDAVMALHDVCTPARRAAFLSQIGVETNGLTALRENLNYTPVALLATFNQRIERFTPAEAQRYGRTADHRADQVMIANIAYENRYGNGPRESGDGWRYRGGGAGHLTFRDNYRRCGTAIGVDLEGHPEQIEQIDIGAMAFGWYWVQGNPEGLNLNEVADVRNLVAVSRAVNGGSNGMGKRLALYDRALLTLV